MNNSIIRNTLLVVLLFSLGPAHALAQDSLVIGNGSTCTLVPVGTTSVVLPLFVQDVAGTPLGRDRSAGLKIQAFSLRFLPSPRNSIAVDGSGNLLISGAKAGLTSSLSPLSEGTSKTSNAFGYRLQFSETTDPILFNQQAAFPGEQVGALTVQLVPGLADGSRIDLLFDYQSAVTLLSNQGGTSSEIAADGTLRLTNACIQVGNGPAGTPLPVDMPAPSGSGSVGSGATITPEVRDAIMSSGSARVHIALNIPFVETQAERMNVVAFAQEVVLNRLSPADFQLLHRFLLAPGLVGNLSRSGLSVLAQLPGIRSIALDGIGHGALAESTALLHVPAVQAMTRPGGVGFFGDGVKVAVIDSGVEKAHPELADSLDNVNGNGCHLADMNQCDGGADHIGHGTAVIGIITANGTAGLGIHSGFAPNAQVLSLKILSDANTFNASDLALALEDIVLNNATWNIRVVNMSVAYGQYTGLSCDNASGLESLTSYAKQLASQGVALIAGTGNNAITDRVAAPACLSSVGAVGATYDDNRGLVTITPPGCTDLTGYGTVTCFTNTSAKLHLIAPGAWLTTTGLLSSPFNGVTTDAVGTSESTPIASAIAALMIQRRPTLWGPEIEGILRYDAGDIVSRNGLQFTDIDALRAVQAVDPAYIRGDANNNGIVTVADVFYLINYLFTGGPRPIFIKGNANRDADLTVADVFYLINYLFAGGPAPVQ